MTREFFELWVYLAATPLAGLTLTLVAYAMGWWIYSRCRMHPLANPVLLAVVLIVLALVATGTSYQTYFAGAQFVHFLLGPRWWAWQCRSRGSGRRFAGLSCRSRALS